MQSPKNYTRYITSIGIIGSLASILSLIYVFVPRHGGNDISVITYGRELLTRNVEDSEPDFFIEYHYKGSKVENLWKYNIRFMNNSEKTLIGVGNQKSLLTDYIEFIPGPEFQILDLKSEKSQFNHNLFFDSSSVKLQFEQWRSKEYLEYVFYVKADSGITAQLFSEPKFRQIIDGDIVFSVSIDEAEPKRLTEYISVGFLRVLYIVSLSITGVFLVFMLWVILITPWTYYAAWKWRRNYYDEYKHFISYHPMLNSEEKEHFKNKPKNLPEGYWNEFSGQVYPNIDINIDINNLHYGILGMIVFSFLVISMCATYIDLIYYFP